MFIVSQVLGDIALADAMENPAELLHFIKKQLNDDVTEDILGAKWRQEFEPMENISSNEEMRLSSPPEDIPGVLIGVQY